MQRQRLRGRRQPRMALPEHQPGHVRGPGRRQLPGGIHGADGSAYRYPRRAALASRRRCQVRQKVPWHGHGQGAAHRPAAARRLMVLHVEALLAGVDIHRDQRPLQGQRLSRPARGHVITATRLRHAPAHDGGHGDGVDVPGRTDQLLLPAPVTPAHTTSGATPGVACARPKCCQPGRSLEGCGAREEQPCQEPPAPTIPHWSRHGWRSRHRAPIRTAGGPGTRPSPDPARYHRPLRTARRR